MNNDDNNNNNNNTFAVHAIRGHRTDRSVPNMI